MSRIRGAIAVALVALVALALVAAAGCGYENRNASEPTPPKEMPRAKERVPVRAICDWRIREGAARTPGFQPAPSAGPKDAAASLRLSAAAEALGDRVTQTGLFERVAIRGDSVAGLREGDVMLMMTESVASTPQAMHGLHLLGCLPGLYPLLWVYVERSTPFAIDFKLSCIDRDDIVLASCEVQSTIFVDAQATGIDQWNMDLEGRVAAEKIAREHAVSVLVAKLASKESLPDELRRRAAPSTGGPVAGTFPPPAGPRRDASQPDAPSPPPPPAAAQSGSTFVLAVGIDRYQDSKIPALRFAEADARETYGFFATERRSPTAADRVLLLAGKDATRRGVREAIREHLIKKATRPEDTVIFYFAGHGFRDAEDTYLACADTEIGGLAETAISMEELRMLWGKVLCERKVLLVDACHSGAVGAVRGIGGVGLAPDAGAASGTGGPLAARSTTLAISATGDNELSTEDANLGHGVFSLALLRGLRGEADANRDGAVTGEELGPYLRNEVPRLAVRAGGRQTPVVTGAERCAVILSR